jgi:hypothetical protein
MKRPSMGRRLAALAATATLVLAGAATAYADDVSNNLDSSIDAVAEVMPLNLGGANGTTELYVTPRNGDGKSGCNLTGGTSLVLSVSSSNTAVATVSPSSVTFSSCGDMPTLTVSPIGVGSATISASQTSNNTGGTFNLAPVTFTVNVAPPPNTAPTVQLTGVSDGASYEVGSVPAAQCSVTDAEDGNSTFAATLNAITGPFADFGVGSQTANCSYTDGGGLSARASATYSIVDTIAPVITDLGPTTDPNAAGWYKAAVENRFSASDGGSGLQLSRVSPWTVSSGPSEGSAVKIASGPVTDNVGNTAPSIDSAAFKIDLSDPTNVAFVDGPDVDGIYPFGYVPPAPTCTADDDVSGLASCLVTGYSTALGPHTLTATATDNSGRTATATRSYTVLAWTLDGFKRPVDKGVVNTVKGGSTVPLKFEVFAGTTEMTNVTAVKSFTTKLVSCTTLEGSGEDPIEEFTSGKTVLRYDSVEGQFIQNWQTPKAPGACYVVTMTTQDGSQSTASFKLK